MIDKAILHYRILEKLGEGGMGVIYRARDTKLERDVAIKLLSERVAAGDAERERLREEAKAAAALTHPNIATIYAFEEVERTMFIVMEYVEGRVLGELIGGGEVTLSDALDILEGAAGGLKAAHSKGIIHRDIKSSNIMVTSHGMTKIMDFGIAKIREGRSITRPGTTVGTVAYMSPEQVQGRIVDHRTDIWSLGVVLYEMLTGELPFTSEYDAALMYAITNQEAPEPSKVNPNVPPELDAIVMKMLEKNANRRYASIEDLMEDVSGLREELGGTGVDEEDKGIAVLPFRNISPEEESDYFSDGLTEELIMNLSRLKDVRVVSRTTSMLYKGKDKSIKDIGRELRVGYILEGSVRKVGDNLRITADLVDVRSDTELWAETFRGVLADVFDIQEQVSKQIVSALMLELTPMEEVVLSKRSTINPQAYDLNQRGREFLYKRSKTKLNTAIQLFERAVELDPRYANAYAGLAEAYATLYQLFETRSTWLDKSMEAGMRALMYDSSLSQAYSALGLSYFNKGSLDEALDASEKAIELDPGDYAAHWILGRIYYLTDRERQAVEQYKKVVELNPDFFSVYNDLLLCYQRLGETESYEQTLQAALEVYPRFLLQHPDDERAHIHFAVRLAEAGRVEEAKREAKKAIELNPEDPLMLYNAACFYARIGERALAVQHLKGSVAAGYQLYDWVKRDPDLDSIRNEPGYLELMEGK